MNALEEKLLEAKVVKQKEKISRMEAKEQECPEQEGTQLFDQEATNIVNTDNKNNNKDINPSNGTLVSK